MQQTAEDVLRFWLGEPGDPPLAKAELWWKKDEAFDRSIKERFEETLERGVRGELSDWQKTLRGRLALIILFDQFSRNMFRGTPRAFAQDPLARAVTRKALDAGDARVLTHTEVSFLLMPLMHAEDLELQKECVERFSKLAEAAAALDEKHREDAAKSVKYARMHMVIVERFGRFPHRNAILGRETTAEEAHFLTQPDSSF